MTESCNNLTRNYPKLPSSLPFRTTQAQAPIKSQDQGALILKTLSAKEGSDSENWEPGIELSF